jgi:hypothetical protein
MKDILDWLFGGSCDYCLHVSADLLEGIGKLGEMRGRKGERHCYVSWFYGME